MKQVIVILALVALATGALAGDPIKQTDPVDYTFDTPSRIQLTGALSEDSPIWHRWRPDDYQAVSVDCMLPMEYEYSVDPAYDFYCFEVSDTEPVEFLVDDAEFDTVVYIYCDPFDPALPTENAVIFDDDDGPGLQSAVQLSDNVTLQPGDQYWLVICSYWEGQYGTYSIQTSDNVALCGGVANEASDWSSIKGLFQ